MASSTVSDPWQRGEKKPTRALVLLFNHLKPGSDGLAAGQHFQHFKGHCLEFNSAWVGHLNATPAVSNLVITTGLVPKHLPWNDSLFHDRLGLLGKKNRFYSTGELSSSALAKILSDLSPSLLRQIPGPKNSKLAMALNTDEAFALASPSTESRILSGTPPPNQAPEAWVTDEILSFFRAEPDWKVVLASFGNSNGSFLKSDESLGRILDYLEQNNLLKDTLIVLSSHIPIRQSSKASSIFNQENLETAVKGSPVRFYLKKKDTNSLLKFTSALKGALNTQEIYYKKQISGRFHYIRSYRSQAVEGYRPTLLNSLASDQSADVLAFLEEDNQAVPLLIWSPNLRFDNPVIKNQMEQTRIRFVDIHPVILELMGLPPEPGLDGSALGIGSLIY